MPLLLAPAYNLGSWMRENSFIVRLFDFELKLSSNIRFSTVPLLLGICGQ
jgi:hypothetical protein